MKPLKNTIALVAGATRGTGRGIACMLGEAGATVYCTGRSTRANRPTGKVEGTKPFALAHRPETIEETAGMVDQHGGRGIPVQTDHTDAAQVEALIERIRAEQGRLDILINDVWGGDELTEWVPFVEHDLQNGLLMLERAVHSHIITAHHAVPLMIDTGKAVLIEITDGDNYGYRGSFFYDLVKTSIIRIAFSFAKEFHPHNIAALALTPGFLRSEAMLDYFGVTEANWRDATKEHPDFSESETPYYAGRVAAALAADPEIMQKTGRVFATWDLAPEYNIKDIDGRQPHFRRWVEENMPERPWIGCDEGFYKYWGLPGRE